MTCNTAENKQSIRDALDASREICQKAKRPPAGEYLFEFIRRAPEKPRFTVRTVNGHEITETVNRKAEWEAARLIDIDKQQGTRV